jgi:hypothetical protein
MGIFEYCIEIISMIKILLCYHMAKNLKFAISMKDDRPGKIFLQSFNLIKVLIVAMTDNLVFIIFKHGLRYF